MLYVHTWGTLEGVFYSHDPFGVGTSSKETPLADKVTWLIRMMPDMWVAQHA